MSVPTTASLWTPDDAITFAPPLASIVYGDDRKVFAFTTTYDRPAFWAIRGDSSWRTWLEDSGIDITDFVDTITENPRRDFGEAEPENEDDESLERYGADPFPAIDLRDGYSWHQLTQLDDPNTKQRKDQTAANSTN